MSAELKIINDTSSETEGNKWKKHMWNIANAWSSKHYYNYRHSSLTWKTLYFLEKSLLKVLETFLSHFNHSKNYG